MFLANTKNIANF